MSLTLFAFSVRSLLRQGRHTVISLAGLSIAMACCILIMLYIRYEFSYDRYHNNAGNLYRVLTTHASRSYMGKDMNVVTPAPLKHALITDIPEVERSCRCKFASTTIEHNSSLYAEEGFLYADPELLEMFTLPVLTGNAAEALKEPFSLFVTRSMALKYFGNQDPIGKTVKVNNHHVYTVTGVLEDIPLNSHLEFNFLTGFETFFRIGGSRERIERWPNFSYLTYIQLAEGAAPESIADDLESLAKRYLPDQPFLKGTTWILQPLKEIHLGGQNNFDPSVQSDMRNIYLVASIGIIIFLIACINYLNMATARCFSRGREIGILKVAGSSRMKLILLLLSEPLLLSCAALLGALVIAFLILPSFAGFTERPLTYSMLFDNSMPLLIILLALSMGVIAGFLPALWLSSFNPLRLIREEFTDFSGKRKSDFLRNILVGIQHIISIVALVSAFTLSGQFRYLQNKDRGFSSGNIITVELKDPGIRQNPFFLVNEIRKNPKIDDVCSSYYLPHYISSSGLGTWDGKPEELQATIFRNGVDTNFFDFFDLEMVTGRAFSKDFRDDTLNNFIINQAAARLLGSGDLSGNRFGFQKQAMGRIVGVVKDFNFQSLKLRIEPLAISVIPTEEFPGIQYVSVKVKKEDIAEIQLFLAQLLKEISPGYINPVSVLSEKIKSMYVSESRLSGLILFSTVLAIILTCLGQYGLSSYTVQKRTREMALRKVFGATPATITSIFSAELAKLMIASFLIAGPVAFLLTNNWLRQYAFRIEPGPLFFIYSLTITVLISYAVVAYNVIRLSRINPAETIRYE
jgi:putative ABC transport system permease protein